MYQYPTQRVVQDPPATTGLVQLLALRVPLSEFRRWQEHTERHTHKRLPAFGKCFGKIGKDGKLKLWYGVWKAKEGGMMVTDGFGELKTETIQMESNKYTAVGFVHAGVQIGAEQHSVETMAKAKATRKGTKVQVLKK